MAEEKPVPPIVLVIWEDAKTLDSSAWTDVTQHTYKPHLVSQVGFLLSHTDEGVILTQAWHPELVGARDQIPIGMIRSITPLAATEKPKRRR